MRNLKTSESFVITKGQERLLGLKVAANNAANQQALKNLINANAIANAVTQQQAQLALTTALAAQAQLALQASGNTAAAAQAANISAAAAASAQRLSALQTQIAAAQARLAAGTDSATEVNNLLQMEEVERNNSNNLSTQLNTLLNNNSGTAGIPTGRAGTTNQPGQSSASVPI